MPLSVQLGYLGEQWGRIVLRDGRLTYEGPMPWLLEDTLRGRPPGLTDEEFLRSLPDHYGGSSWAEVVEVPDEKSVPDYRQDNRFSCGPAALQWALHALGAGVVAEADLARELGTSPERGTWPAAMIAAAAAHGLTAAEQHLGGIDLLAKHTARGGVVLCPVQMHESSEDERRRRQSGHWVVVRSIDGDRVSYHDPARGEDGGAQAIGRDEWSRRWRDCAFPPAGGTRWFVRYGIYLSRKKER